MADIKERQKYRGSDTIHYGGAWFYWLTLKSTKNKYLGYYRFTELRNIQEMAVTPDVLRNRLTCFRNGSKSFKSAWDCVVTPQTLRLKYDTKRNDKREIEANTLSLETKSLMKLWPISNLIKQENVNE